MNQDQFIKKINIVLVEVDKMINNCDEYSYTNKQQLISIKNELYDMMNYLNSESIFQQKKGKEFLLSRIVIDSWPFINGQVIIKEQGFGGPLLYFNRKIYIPVFIRRFCVVGFRLATLNVDDLSIEYIGDIEDLIYLKEIKGNRIYFYTDIYKSTEKNLTLYEQI